MNAGVVGNVNGIETYIHRLIDIATFKVQSNTRSLATGIVDFGCYPELSYSKHKVNEEIYYGKK